MTITCDGCGATNLTTAIKTGGGWLCRNCDRERADANAQETKDGWPQVDGAYQGAGSRRPRSPSSTSWTGEVEEVSLSNNAFGCRTVELYALRRKASNRGSAGRPEATLPQPLLGVSRCKSPLMGGATPCDLRLQTSDRLLLQLVEQHRTEREVVHRHHLTIRAMSHNWGVTFG